MAGGGGSVSSVAFNFLEVLVHLFLHTQNDSCDFVVKENTNEL
jgi:hypothetical protein